MPVPPPGIRDRAVGVVGVHRVARRLDGKGWELHKGKAYADALGRFDRRQLYAPAEAIELVKSVAHAKFDETLELAVRLGVDPRKADQMVRGSLSLPAGTGRSVKVAAFAAGEAAAEARAAGADYVGADDLVARIAEGGSIDFDVAIATPDLMVQVGKLGRILGPRGLMPNPKTGTVTNDVGKAVSEYKSGRVEYRTDRVGNVHVPIGKVSFGTGQVLDNFRAVIDELVRAKPAAAKGRYLKTMTVSSTMGPGVKVDPAKVREITDEMVGGALVGAAASVSGDVDAGANSAGGVGGRGA